MFMKLDKLIRSTVLVGLVVAATGTAAQAQEYAIGVPVALTGNYAFVGTPTRNGIVLALEEAQAEGTLGPTKLKVIVEDDGSDKGQVVTLVRRMAVQDRVLMIIGPSSSVEAVAAAPVVNDLKVPLITNAASDEVLKAGPWSFKAFASSATVMGAVSEYVIARKKPKNVVLVFARDNDGLIGQKNAVRDVMKAANVTILSEESIASSETDFTALATKLVAAKPDAVLLATGAETGAALLIQARQAGLAASTTIFAVPAMGTSQFLKVGGPAVEGVIFPADFFDGGTNPLGKKFVSAYQRKYGESPDNFAALSYAMAKVSIEAIRRAGPNPTREAVRNALQAIKDLPTILGRGTFSFGAGRQPSYGTTVLEVHNGANVLAN